MDQNGQTSNGSIEPAAAAHGIGIAVIRAAARVLKPGLRAMPATRPEQTPVDIGLWFANVRYGFFAEFTFVVSHSHNAARALRSWGEVAGARWT